MAFDLGLVWSIFNFICGLAIFIFNFYGFSVCSILNMIFGVSICWLAVTHRICDQYALTWFPLWENFLFTGLTFLYFTCGVFYINFDAYFGFGFLYLFVFIVGCLYVIFWILIKFAGVNIPTPVPLETLCGGGGGGGSSAAAGGSGGSGASGKTASGADGGGNAPTKADNQAAEP